MGTYVWLGMFLIFLLNAAIGLALVLNYIRERVWSTERQRAIKDR